jgi:hypothetical protein
LWGAAALVQSCDAHLNIICEGLCCLFQKSALNPLLLLLNPLIFWWMTFIKLDNSAFCLWNCKTAGLHLIHVKHLYSSEFKLKKEKP